MQNRKCTWFTAARVASDGSSYSSSPECLGARANPGVYAFTFMVQTWRPAGQHSRADETPALRDVAQLLPARPV